MARIMEHGLTKPASPEPILKSGDAPARIDALDASQGWPATSTSPHHLGPVRKARAEKRSSQLNSVASASLTEPNFCCTARKLTKTFSPRELAARSRHVPAKWTKCLLTAHHSEHLRATEAASSAMTDRRSQVVSRDAAGFT